MRPGALWSQPARDTGSLRERDRPQLTRMCCACRLAEIRRSLYCLFATYGKVLDVVHVRKPKTRGTAFVVFRDLASTTAAMRGLDGESFYGKSLVSRAVVPQSEVSMRVDSATLADPTFLRPRARRCPQRIAYAKATSHATIAQTEGPEAVYAIKLGLRDADDAGKKSKLTVSAAQKKLADDRREAKRGRQNGNGAEEEEEEEDEDDEEGPQKKKSRQDGEDEDGAFSHSLYLAAEARYRRRVC